VSGIIAGNLLFGLRPLRLPLRGRKGVAESIFLHWRVSSEQARKKLGTFYVSSDLY
jgi:hypothetical protein